MIKSILFATVAALSISTAALAADAVYEAPAEPPAAVEPAAFSWAGGYLGAHGGYGFGNGDIEGVVEESFDGARFGGFAGYNWQMSGGFVVGLEGDVNYDWNEENVLGSPLEGKSGLNWSARARAGYAMDRALFFAAAGYTGTNVEANVGSFSADDTLHGWTVGGGVDYALTDRMFTRVEYRYNDFGSGNVGGADVKFDQHVVNVGLGVKF